MIAVGVILRLAPHVPNYAPITAIALFGGVYLSKKFAILIPLLAIVLSDYLLLYVNPYGTPVFDFHKVYPLQAMFHATTMYVWGSFVVSGLIGIWLSKRKKPIYVVGAALFASLQFYLITNFGVWAAGMYGRGLDGLLLSYIMAIPFFKWTILGDLVYTGVFFGAYELVVRIANKNFAFARTLLKNKIN